MVFWAMLVLDTWVLEPETCRVGSFAVKADPRRKFDEFSNVSAAVLCSAPCGAYPDGGKHDHVIDLLAALGPGRLNQILRLGLDQYSRYCIESIFQVMD